MSTCLYDGSRLLEPVAWYSGVAVDHVNFFGCAVIAIAIGLAMRVTADLGLQRGLPILSGQTFRLSIECSMGLLFLYFCFGYYMSYFLLQLLLAYVLIRILPYRLLGPMVTISNIVYLSIAHLRRMNIDEPVYCMDITGPLMMLTQRVSRLAYNIADGEQLRRGERLAYSSHVTRSVSSIPTMLEYLGYTCSFQCVLIGPVVSFTDFMDYIRCYGLQRLPSAKDRFLELLSATICFVILYAYVSPMLPMSLLLSADIERLSIPRKLIASYIIMFLSRHKYYLAWSVVELGNLSAGLGYRGCVDAKCDGHGRRKFKSKGNLNNWVGVKSFYYMKTEFGNSLKVALDGWNVSTTQWLRETAYERMPPCIRTVSVFIISTVWHGFYPAYYLFFFSMLLFTIVSRILRRSLRPHFQNQLLQRVFYDVLTTLVARLIILYTQPTFHFLLFQPSMLYWRMSYFLPHAIALGILIYHYLKPRIQNKMLFHVWMPSSMKNMYSPVSVSKR